MKLDKSLVLSMRCVVRLPKVHVSWCVVALLLLVGASQNPRRMEASLNNSPFNLAWSSVETNGTSSVAWGDYEGDGDLDLVAGNNDYILLYQSDRGRLSTSAVWSSTEQGRITAVAWGDYDNDGDLDLAATADAGPARVYQNTAGALEPTASWTSDPQEWGQTRSVAWGDVDGDGYLDLAVGFEGAPTRLYHYDKDLHQLIPQAAWSSDEHDLTWRVTWGDYDGDGDLDLATGSTGSDTWIGSSPVRLYRNDNGQLTTSAVWSSPQNLRAIGVAWGDYDGDGDLDLAVDHLNEIYLYRNDSQANAPPSFTQALTIEHSPKDATLIWGDYDKDGDLDLAASGYASPGERSQIYRNDLNQSGAFVSVWSQPQDDLTYSIAWADYDGDGDLDLTTASTGAERIYRNDTILLSAGQRITWEKSAVSSVAWGDVDNDGDLDLAVGNGCWEQDGNSVCYPNRVYANQGTGELALAWTAQIISNTASVAWGDVDNDGDLDLAVGNGCIAYPDAICYPQANQLYRNDHGTLSPLPSWTSDEVEPTTSVAWGDVDNDGDLDLAVGNYRGWEYPTRVYRNDAGTLTTTSIWSSGSGTWTMSIAWGDVDNDGDLDLAVGNNGKNMLYRNDRGALEKLPMWSSFEEEHTTEVVWGDYDSDGDLDLAVGGYHPLRLYRNDGGTLTERAVWTSLERAETAIAWVDYDGDGDLDLSVGDDHYPRRLYQNDQGVFTNNTIPLQIEWHQTLGIAWGDMDGDGDADLATADYEWEDANVKVYRNMRIAQHTQRALPAIRIVEPVAMMQANFYASPHIWSSPTISFSYILSHPSSLPVQKVIAMYSLDGGGHWRAAVAASGTITEGLTTSPDGTVHRYVWDIASSGVMGQSDNVVFRLLAVPSVSASSTTGPGPYVYGSATATTFPFRVRGRQVQVRKAAELPTETTPISNAIVYRLPIGHAHNAQILTDKAGIPFRTDMQGYLQGYSQLYPGDGLVALQPISVTKNYTLYHTSAMPTSSGLEFQPVSGSGVQTLTVSAQHPLMLFHLDVSLEWDARQEPLFLEQLQANLRRTSELLYDVTNGQAALGDITIYNNHEQWDNAHIRIYASNSLRPSATLGGIVDTLITDTTPLTRPITYTPGIIYMGSVWDRFGDSRNPSNEDWARALLHELGHYIFFLDETYLGQNNNGLLIPIHSCKWTVMSDPYRDDYSEFLTDAAWLPACQDTLAHRTTGRSEWKTITTFYPWLSSQPLNAGPSGLPLQATRIRVIDAPTMLATTPESAPIERTRTQSAASLSTVEPGTPIFSLYDEGHIAHVGPGARAFLFQGERLIDLGRPSANQLEVHGGQTGDRVCVYELTPRVEVPRLGCETIKAGDRELDLITLPNWQPEIILTPVTSQTIEISVTIDTSIPAGVLKARLYPDDIQATDPITLERQTSGSYKGTFHLREAVFAGAVHVWIEGQGSPQEIVVSYGMGGNPGFIRTRGGFIRTRGGFMRTRGAPATSFDGQVTLFGDDLNFNEGEFVVLQAVPVLPEPPRWAMVVGQGHRLSISPHQPSLTGASLIFDYFGGDVPPGEEQWLKIYHWDGQRWQSLPTVLDMHHNTASTEVIGAGIYALMSSIELRIQQPGWNLFSYPIQDTRPVSEALVSITDVYTTVYGYDRTDSMDPWKVYDQTVPSWVNDLTHLEFGKSYWINVTEPITLSLRGGPAMMQHVGNFSTPPATYYGVVSASPAFTPTAGMSITARINGQICGQGYTRSLHGQIVYSIDVLGVEASQAPLCGTPGQIVTFYVDGQLMEQQAVWDHRRLHELRLQYLRNPVPPARQLYFPYVFR